MQERIGDTISGSFALINVETAQINALLPTQFSLTNLSFATGSGQNFSWSPDGRYLAFTGQQANGVAQFYLYSLQDNRVSIVHASINEVFRVSWADDSQHILLQGESCHADYNDCAYTLVVLTLFLTKFSEQ